MFAVSTVPPFLPSVCVRSPNASVGQAWSGFLGTYREAWGRRHGLLTLMSHPASGTTLACVRAGGMMTALRGCTDVEAVWMASAPSSASAATRLLSSDSELLAVHECVRGVSALLGPLCMDTFVMLMAKGAQQGLEAAISSPALRSYGRANLHIIF